MVCTFYFVNRISGLGEIGVERGLDKKFQEVWKVSHYSQNRREVGDLGESHAALKSRAFSSTHAAFSSLVD